MHARVQQRNSTGREVPASPVRKTADPDSPLRHLQRSIGNHAVQRALQFAREEPAAEDPHELEADRAADAALSRLDTAPQPASRGALDGPRQPSASGVAGLGAGRPLSRALRPRFEQAFGWDFSGVRLHAGPTAASIASRLGARAFTSGRDIVFGGKVHDPEAGAHRRLLAHELAHVVQQDMSGSRGAPSAPTALSPAPAGSAQALPLVTNVVTSAAELGVGGRDVTATATVAGARTRVTWVVNPGGAAPAGVTVIGTGRRVRIRSAQRPPGTPVIGGTPITIQAQVTGTPGDSFNAPPVMLVQVVSAAYAAAPALANIAFPGGFVAVAPPNSAEPNRDGIGGNTAVVNAVTAPAGRLFTVAFRRSLGARVAGTTITPGRRTGDIRLRITDTATAARLNETTPTGIVGAPAVMMADLTVNAVPTRVAAVGRTGPLGPYGQLDPITFASSDAEHPPLTRVVGELMANIRDDFNLGQLNAALGGFNNAFVLALSAPANRWNDQLTTGAGALNVADGRPAIDVNRFAGPGVPHLPRSWIIRQRMVYSSWAGAATIISTDAPPVDDGRHVRSLIGTPAAPQFRTRHFFGGRAAPAPPEAYVGNPLIVLTNVAAAPLIPTATALAADGTATANLTVNSNVAGRTIRYAFLSGDAAITAGNPAVLPAPATIRGGVRNGRFRIRAEDTVFPNRRVEGRVRVEAVRLRSLRATPRRVAPGVLVSTVDVIAEPGGRTLNWASNTPGVVVAPLVTGPGRAMNVTVTRPAGFTGTVRVTATDSVLAARTASVRITFR
jgi:hypothetical protein